MKKPRIKNNCCPQRDEKGFSVAAAVALAGVVSIAVVGAYSLIMPTYQRAQNLRYSSTVRAAAEACADYVVSDLNNSLNLGQASQYDSAASNTYKDTIMPASIIGSSGGVVPAVTVRVQNISPPSDGSCAFYDPNKDPFYISPTTGQPQNLALPQKNGYRVVTTKAVLGTVVRSVQVVLMPNYQPGGGATMSFFNGPATSQQVTIVGGQTKFTAYNHTLGGPGAALAGGGNNSFIPGNDVTSNGYVILGSPQTQTGGTSVVSGKALVGNVVSYGTGTINVQVNSTSMMAALTGGSIANDPTATTTLKLTGNSINSGSIVQGTVATAGTFVPASSGGGVPSYVNSSGSTLTGNVQDLGVPQSQRPTTTAGTISGPPTAAQAAAAPGTAFTVDTSNGTTPFYMPPAQSAPVNQGPFPASANTLVSTIQITNGGMIYVQNGATQPTGSLVLGGSGSTMGSMGGGGHHSGGTSTSTMSATIPPGPYSINSLYAVGGASSNGAYNTSSWDGSGIVIASNVTTPLQLFVQGAGTGNSAIVLADGGITNQTNNPAMAQIWYNGSKGVWVGDSDGNTASQFVLYAPNAPVQVDAIGQGQNMSGSIVGNTIMTLGGGGTQNGGWAIINYDLALATAGAFQHPISPNSYALGSMQAVSWREQSAALF